MQKMRVFFSKSYKNFLFLYLRQLFEAVAHLKCMANCKCCFAILYFIMSQHKLNSGSLGTTYFFWHWVTNLQVSFPFRTTNDIYFLDTICVTLSVRLMEYYGVYTSPSGNIFNSWVNFGHPTFNSLDVLLLFSKMEVERALLRWLIYREDKKEIDTHKWK